MSIGESISGAIFNEDRAFRFALWRIWDTGKPALLFIGLNPSNAGEIRDDPTIRRVIGFAKSWGYGGLYVGNLFALVTPEPVGLHTRPTFRSKNMAAIKKMAGLAKAVLVGWGAFGQKAGTRPAEVLALIGDPVYCLGTTKEGEPKHPLYLRYDSRLVRYERGPA